MTERLIEPKTERSVLPSDQLPNGLSGYAALERVEDIQGRFTYWGLKRQDRLTSDAVEQAFTNDPAIGLEEAFKQNSEISELRRQFEEYKASTDERISLLESANAELLDQLRDVEAERDELAEQNSLLRMEAGMPEPRQSGNRLKTGWNRITGGIGSRLLNKQVELHNGLYIYKDRLGRKIVVQEEVVDGYPESSRRAGTAAVVGAVALAATVAGAYILGKMSGSVDGMSEEEAQRIVSQNSNIIQNQENILEMLDPNGPEQAGTAFTEIDDKLAQLESIIDPNGPEIDGDSITALEDRIEHIEEVVDENGSDTAGDSFSELESRVDAVEDKMTQDHRELHGDIHPDAPPGDAQEVSPSGSVSPDDGGGNGVGENQSQGDIHRESLEFRGNTIWGDVEKNLRVELGYSPSDAQIHKAASYVLRINNLTWEQARYLPLGFSYKMPENLSSLIN